MYKGMCYVDMDGVTAGFEVKAYELFGPKWKFELGKPGWGAFAKYPSLFRDLPVLPGALDLMNTAINLYGLDNVSKLTALPKRAHETFTTAAEDKIYWARAALHPHLKVSFGPFAKDKQFHCRGNKDVLIDDMKINIDQWEAAGGVGIWHRGDMEETISKLIMVKHSEKDI